MSPQSKRSGLIAGGNFIVDQVKTIDAWPPQDALANIISQTTANGGSAYNILKNLARLGASFPLEAIGLVGDDAQGRFILDDCRVHGIETTRLKSTPDAATSYTDVMTAQGSGRRTFFHQRGANALLSPGHFDFSTTRARHFHLGYALLLDALDANTANGRSGLAEVLARARDAGLTTSLDCVSENSDRFSCVVRPVLPEVDVLFANDFETEKLTGISLRQDEVVSPSAVVRAGHALIDAGVRTWVVIHFPEITYARNHQGHEVWQPSVRMPANRIAGAAGAGDALAAGILMGMHERWPMSHSLQLGVCAAAASLEHATCSEAVRPSHDCLELGQLFGFGAAVQ